MTANNADYFGHTGRHGPPSVEELDRRQGVSKIATVEDLAANDIFQTDEELTEFLRFVSEQRNASRA
jgi:hypothetical protein